MITSSDGHLKQKDGRKEEDKEQEKRKGKKEEREVKKIKYSNLTEI